MGEFVDFDVSKFPVEIECADCGDVLTVTHEEAENSAHAGVTIPEAVKTVRQSRGWWTDPDRVHCPRCITTLEERSQTIRRTLTEGQTDR